MYKPIILLLALAVAISLVSFSMAQINFAIAQEKAPSEGFSAILSGGEEVPPVDTAATGVASFIVEGGESIKYDVNVTGMDKVTAAHIHNAPKGENGEVVVTLFKADSPTGQISGSLANGSITTSNLKGRCREVLSAT